MRPIDARWELKQGGYLNPQWRLRLTIPPWLPEKEVLRAYRRMQGQILGGVRLPKTSTPLEVAHFVRKRARLDGYKNRSWESLRKQWNEERPDVPFKTYSNFRTYFARGDKAVMELNFGWPRPGEKDPSEELFDVLKEALRGHRQLGQMTAWEVLTKVSAEEVARQLVEGGYLIEQPSPQLVETVLRSIDVEEQALGTE